MRNLITFLIFLTFVNQSSGQKNNIKAGSWSDLTVWSNLSLPTSFDDVVLNFDIIVDTNAVCQSLTLNGNNVTVNADIHLDITGNDNATLLSSFIQVDTTLLAPYDTVMKLIFHYDTCMRNTSIDHLFYENGKIKDYGFQSTFFYYGDDTLPFKRVVTTPFLPVTDDYFSIDTSYYFYTNDIVTEDSSTEFFRGNYNTTVNKYTYYSDRIVTTTITYNSFSPNGLTKIDTVDITYDKGNIIHQVDSTQSFSGYDFTFVYDDHPNPFYHTQSKIAINNSFPYYQVETSIADVFAKNNALQIDQVIKSNNYDSHSSFIYQYKLNGYPKVVWSANDFSKEYLKGFYIYTN